MIKLEKTEVRQEVTKKIKTLTDGEIALKEKSCPLKLDILKLSDCVIFPGTVVPLVIDEPEQIQLIDEALNRDCILGVILSPEQSKKTESYLLPENPEEVQETGTEKISRIGCMVQIHRIVGFEEKFLRILVAGIERFHILENENADQEVFRGVQVEYLPDLSPTESEQEQLRVLATRLQSLFEDYIKLVPALSKDVKLAALTAGEPSVLANRAAFALSLSMEEKYELLETRNVRKRIERLIALAEREIELARLDERILKATDHRLLKLQRDNYLREQLKSIQKELGNDAGQEIRLLREQIYLRAAAFGDDFICVAGVCYGKKLSRLAGFTALEEEREYRIGFGSCACGIGSESLWIIPSKGASFGVFSGNEGECFCANSDTLSGWTFRSRKDIFGEESGRSHGAEVLPYFPGRNSRCG